jgi:hypothetical protein
MSVARDLHGAARRGDAEAVRQLLERGTDPNAQVSLEEGFAQPCFFAAATNGHLDTCVRLFWEYGADLAGTRDSAGENVLGLLGRLGKDEAAEWVHRLSSQPRPGPPKDWRELLARAIESAARDEGAEERREEAGLAGTGREAREAVLLGGNEERQEARVVQRERTNEATAREEPRREEAYKKDRREERDEAMRRAERGAVLGELAQRLAAVGAERGALARQDAALAAEQHALVAQLQLLARLS